MIYERWTNEFSGRWAAHLLNIKFTAESVASRGKRNG
jgi:hypothetical protein